MHEINGILFENDKKIFTKNDNTNEYSEDMIWPSRFLGKDIITIREAAWLTDNTYKYEDVVRMMGEVVATLKGNIRVSS